MKPAINVITLGVLDLERSLAFYRDGLGMPTEGIVGTEFEGGAVVFIRLDHGVVLALYPRRELAKDAGLAFDEDVWPNGRPAIEFSLGQFADSRTDVDRVMKEAENAGATIVEAARDRVWGGYSGYFQDPDGHLWEIVWNPDFASQE